MRLLLDTHILLWWLQDARSLPAQADRLIADTDNEVFVSAMSVWEISIKAKLGKITANAYEISEAVPKSGFRSLPFTSRHAAEVANLPNHHRDPFDRALVAQSRVEPMHLLTHDAILGAYGYHVLLVRTHP